MNHSIFQIICTPFFSNTFRYAYWRYTDSNTSESSRLISKTGTKLRTIHFYNKNLPLPTRRKKWALHYIQNPHGRLKKLSYLLNRACIACFVHLWLTPVILNSCQEGLCRALHKDFLKDQPHERRNQNNVCLTKNSGKNKSYQTYKIFRIHFLFFFFFNVWSKFTPAILLLRPDYLSLISYPVYMLMAI